MPTDVSMLPTWVDTVAQRLAAVEGVVAVVLGGSWARGDARPNSDIDLGIYYEPGAPLDTIALRRLAQELDDRHLGDLVTDIGGWGPWINGGGWLDIEGHRVDWIFRDLAKVREVIDECLAGRPVCHYQPGHPLGFCTPIYLAEIALCRPLEDATGAIAPLKALTTPYPSALRQALMHWLWEADFSIAIGRKSAARGEAFYVSGCLFRCAAVMTQVIFALNERYCMNEKGAVALADTFTIRPEGFGEAIQSVLAQPGTDAQALSLSLDTLETLVAETRKLCERHA